MKHLYALVLSLFAIVFGASAQTPVTFFLEIDNAEAVTVRNLATVLEMHNGINTIEANQYQQIMITANSGYLITKYITGAGYQGQVSNNSVSIYVYESNAGQTFKITTCKEDEFRNSSFELWVDNPEKVSAVLGGTGTPITGLVAGSNTVKYNDEMETYVTIKSANYSTPLYKVLKDGEVLTSNYGEYGITLSEGLKIEVFADYPDIDVPVKFVFTNEGTSDFITSVAVDNVPVDAETYLSDNFTVKVGQYLSVTGNTNDYMVNSCTVNGAIQGFFGSYGGTILEETTIELNVKKYETFTKKIFANNPDQFTLYKGYQSNNDVVEFTDGEAEVELSEKNAMMQLVLKSGYKLVKLLDGEKDITSTITAYYNYLTASAEGDLIIETTEIVYDQEIVVYIDDRAAATSYFNFQNSSYNAYDLSTGYNTVKYYAEQRPFSVTWWGAEFNNLYLNDVKQTGQYGVDTNYIVNPENGDVVKIFFTCNPESYKLSITNNYGEDVVCTKDLIVPITDFAEQTVLQGTLVEIAAPEDKEIKITIGDAEPFTAASYSFNVDADTEITIDNPETTGISAVSTTSVNDTKVYNIQGMYLGEKSDLDNLPAGIYIVGGKKLLKK